MAEGLASAVSVPDQDPIASSQAEETNLKRKSSITDPDTKRRRLSSFHDGDGDRESSSGPVPEDGAGDRVRRSIDVIEPGAPGKEGEREDERKSSTAAATGPAARPGRRDEERKRGQRLFGALLGTLSQSSNSASQRRRANIEQRQQDKLKLQDEEYDGLRKQRRDERMAIRKKEQRVYEEESMQTRHSNLLSMAHFLKTRTQPVLYYKPWQLRSRDEDTIREQIIETEQTIAREVADFKTRYPPPDPSNEQQPTATQQDHTTPPAKQETEGKAEKQPVTEQAPAAAPLPESAPKETDHWSHDAKGTVTPAATAATTTTTHAASDTVGSETTNRDQSSGDPARTIDKLPTTSTSASSNPDHHHDPHHHHQHHDNHHDSHHHPDDGGEVVEEDKEDTVIY